MISEQRYSAGHLGGLRRFAIAISVLTILGHTILGFEQSILQPLVALATAYSMQFILETIEAKNQGRSPRYLGGFTRFIDFFLSAHISALALAMLIYYNDRIWDLAFATSVAIASKYLFRAPVGNGSKHIFNPSNLGITVVLLAFPWIGLAPPWQFMVGLNDFWDCLFPVILFTLGTLINTLFTKRIVLIFGWIISFLMQAVIRYVFFDGVITQMLTPLTGIEGFLFTFYMAPDPATTPSSITGQLLFGFSIGAVYGIFMVLHVPYALLFALTIICAIRGLHMYYLFYFKPIQDFGGQQVSPALA